MKYLIKKKGERICLTFSEADYKVLTYEELLKVNGAKGGSGATGPKGPSSGAGNSSSGKDKGKTSGNNSKSGSSSNGGKGGAKGGQNAPSNTESHQTAPSDSNTGNTSNTNGGQNSTSEMQQGNAAGTNESSGAGKSDIQTGPKYVENSHEGVANAKPGDRIIRDNRTEVVLNQGDINYAKEQLKKSGAAGGTTNTSGNSGSGAGESVGVTATGSGTGSGTTAEKSSGSGRVNTGSGILTPSGINPHNPQGGNAVSGTSAGKKSESGTTNYESGHGTQPEVETNDTYGKKGENELADGCSTESKKTDQEKVSLTPPGINPYDPYGKNEEHSENSATNDDYKIGNETTADTYTENDKGDDAPRRVENSDEGVANARPGDWIIRKGGDKAILTKGDIDAAREKVYGSSSSSSSSGSTSGTDKTSCEENGYQENNGKSELAGEWGRLTNEDAVNSTMQDHLRKYNKTNNIDELKADKSMNGNTSFSLEGCKMEGASKLLTEITGNHVDITEVNNKYDKNKDGLMTQEEITAAIKDKLPDGKKIKTDYWEVTLSKEKLDAIANSTEGTTYVLGRAEDVHGGQHWIVLEGYSVNANGQVEFDYNGTSINDANNNRKFVLGDLTDYQKKHNYHTISKIETYTIY